MTPQEMKLKDALRFVTIYMIQAKMEQMQAEIFSDGDFYVVEVKVRKVVE